MLSTLAVLILSSIPQAVASPTLEAGPHPRGLGNLSTSSPVASAPCQFGIPPVLMNGTTTCVSLPPPAMDPCSSLDMMLGLPSAPTDELLVMFHGFGSDELFEGTGSGSASIDTAIHRDELMDAAMARGMYILSVRATCTFCTPASDLCLTYGGTSMHAHVEDAIEYMLTTYPAIDRRRIFAFAWSMGGGDALSYGARNLDVDGYGGMFAGIWARSATASIPAVWDDYATDTPQDIVEGLLGVMVADPDRAIREFAGASVAWIRDGAAASSIDLDQSFAWNLVDRPVTFTRGVLTEAGGVVTAFDGLQFAFPTEFSYSQTTQMNHLDWSDFNANAVLATFPNSGLGRYPGSGTTLTFEDGRYYYFDVEHDDTALLAKWEWTIDPTAGVNSIVIKKAKNLKTIAFDLVELGLNPNATVQVKFTQPGGPNTDVIVRGFTSQPSVTTCAAVGSGAFIIPGPTTWQWDGAAMELTLHEPFGPTWCLN